MKYCAIEGSSFVGKTSICREFGHLGIATIGEYDEFVSLDTHPVTLDDHKNFIDSLIHAERLRSEQMSKQKDSLVVSDRSIISFIAFEDMAHTYGVGDRELRPSIREYLNSQLEREICIGNIVTNNCVLVARLDDEEEFNNRVKQRGVTPIPQLADFSVSQYVADRSALYAEQLVGMSATAQVDMSPYNQAEAARASLAAIEQLQIGGADKASGIQYHAVT